MRLSLLLLLMLVAQVVPAALREVTHSPGAGQYASVAAALAVASDNDVIEIIDNSAVFTGAVHIDGSVLSKNNLTLRGKAGLNPRPTIVGTGAANPFDAGVRCVMTYQNAVDNLVVQDLIFQGSASDDVVLDARFWNGGTFTNCDFLAVSGWNAVRSQVATTFNNCTMSGSSNTVEHFFGGPLILDGCRVNGVPDNGMNISGGIVTIRNKCRISTNGATSIFIHGEFAGNNPTVTVQDSIVTHGPGGGNLMVVNPGSTGAGVASLTIDNCDLIGDVSNYPATSATGAGLILNTTMAALNVRDTIFFNIASVAYALNGNTAGIAGFEDYNVYQKAPNNLQDQGLTRGANNLYLADADPLYLDVATSDFRLLSNSAAATLNSTGTPAYAGSQGLPVAAARLEVKHNPGAGQYATVTAALAAASPNTLIEIIDNSAPYIEQINVTKADITIRGLASLNPRPTIRGTGAANPYNAGLGATVFVYQNAPRLAVEYLNIEAGASDQVVVDTGLAGGASFTNCTLKGRTGGLAVLNSSAAATFTGCSFTGASNTIIHRAGGPLLLSACDVRDGSTYGLNIYGGDVQVRTGTRISAKSATTILMHGEVAGDPPDLDMLSSILATDHTGGNNLLVVNPGATGAGVARIKVDNCDVIGSLVGYPAASTTGAGILLNTEVASMQFLDTIFFNIASVAFALNGKAAGLSAGIEDWCVYSRAPNNLQDQGVERGLHSIAGEALYVNPLGGDFRIYENTSAATRNSAGSPGWLGSQGPAPLKHPNGFDRTYSNVIAGFRNMYNPCVVVDGRDATYPYRMFFFGWAANDCNTGYSGCDAIFLARSNDLVNWQVRRANGSWDATGNPSLWAPVISAQNLDYDEWHNGDPSVVIKDGTYYIAYSSTGFNSDGIQDGVSGDTDGDILCIMGATSPDGINWTKSTAPLLLHPADVGRRPVYEQDPNFTGTFHRPSLMFDGNRWRMWFDYWAPGPKGVCMGLAECAPGADPMIPSNWVIQHNLANPIIQEWVNPDVVKFDGIYHTFADPSGYNNSPGWPNRQVREATSTDGINWTRVPFFVDPDPDTQANQVPQASVLNVGGKTWLYLFYACQNGGLLSNYDYRYSRIRWMRRELEASTAAELSWFEYN